MPHAFPKGEGFLRIKNKLIQSLECLSDPFGGQGHVNSEVMVAVEEQLYFSEEIL